MKSQLISALLCFGMMTSFLYAEPTYPSLSPKGWIKQIVGNTNIEIEYERPSARGRTVFGELVPWDELWRTGAGHSTKISFDQDVLIGGQKIPKGQYSIFSIPNKHQWTVILNSDTSLYGTFNYQREKDVIRFDVQSTNTQRYYEAFTIDIDLIPNNARIYLSWERTQIGFDILTGTDDEMHSYINERLMERKSKDSDRYAGAAEYLYYQNTDHQKAITLANMALELDASNGWARRLKMSLYERQELYSQALETIAEALAELETREQNELTTQNSIKGWRDHRSRIERKIAEASN